MRKSIQIKKTTHRVDKDYTYANIIGYFDFNTVCMLMIKDHRLNEKRNLRSNSYTSLIWSKLLNKH